MRFDDNSIKWGRNESSDVSLMIEDTDPWYPIEFVSLYRGTPDAFLLRLHEVGEGLLQSLSFYTDGTWSESMGFERGTWTAGMWFDDPVPSQVPVPATAILLLSGLLPMIGIKKWRRD